MADQYGIDVGNILSNVENIRGARVRNALAENELDRIQRGQRERENALSGVNAPTAGLAVVDPSGAIQIENYLNSLSEQERKERQDAAEITGRMAVNVLQSEDPEVAYQQVRAQMPAEIQSEMPPTYDQEWVEKTLAEATMISDILSGGGQQQEVTPRTDPGKAKADLDAGLITQEQYDQLVAPEMAEGTGARDLDSADTNAIFRQAQSYFGEVDPLTGDMRILDPTLNRDIQSVAARASEIWSSDQSLSHSQAVEMAIRELGLWSEVVNPEAGQQEGTDDSGVIDFTDFFGVPE